MPKFYTRWNHGPYGGRVMDDTPLDELDQLRPYSVGEMVQRATLAGENLNAIRRRELASLRGVEIDDPEDIETAMDDCEADLVTAHNLARSRAKARSKEASGPAVVKPEATPEPSPESGLQAGEPDKAP